MARGALVAGAFAAVPAFGIGLAFDGLRGAVSAGLGVTAVSGSFAVYAGALGAARRHSPAAVQVVALAGWLVRLGFVVGLLFALSAVEWFDLPAFGIAALAGAVVVAGYEAKLALGGLAAAREATSGTTTGGATR
jgi:hypothetical protein